jgi:replication fork protection complex subunit Csm3/Swi3
MAPLNASRAPASPSFDDNDDLFNSADIDEIFREVDTSTKIDIHDTKPSKNDSKDLGATLGIDEEVKVTKKRKPIAKLDDAR